MAIKVFEIRYTDAEGKEMVKTVQVKRRDMVWKFIAEKIREGLLPATAQYTVSKLDIE